LWLARSSERVRRIGVFMPGVSDDPEFQARNAAFVQGLGELDWTAGRNVRFEYRWGAGDPERYRAIASELVGLKPDAILALGTSTVSALKRATRAVPIVCAGHRPSRQRIGRQLGAAGWQYHGRHEFQIRHEREMVGAAEAARVAVLRDQASPDGIEQFAGMQGVAPALGVELTPVDVRDVGEVERGLLAFCS
jgi:putative ABC transport system substrate-binding protein